MRGPTGLTALAAISSGVGIASLALAAVVAEGLPHVGATEDPVSRSLVMSALFLYYVVPGVVLGLGLIASGGGCWLRWRWAVPAAAVFLVLEALWAAYIAVVGSSNPTADISVSVGWMLPAALAVVSVIGVVVVFLPGTRIHRTSAKQSAPPEEHELKQN